MTDAEIESILITLPATNHRAKTLQHLYRMREQIKHLEAELDALRLAPVPEKDTTPQILAWLRATHTADTVRAQYARKLADRIAAGEYQDAASERSE